MRKTRLLAVTIALATAAALYCSGCLAMMIPGMAYSGYKYAHDKNQPAASSTTSNTQSAKSTSAPQPQKIPDSEIE